MEKENKKNTRKKWERRLALLALLLLAAAWIAGNFVAREELMPFLQQARPGAGHIEPLTDNLFQTWQDETKTENLGYLSVTATHGYGGAMKVICSVSPSGIVEDLLVAGHKETPSFFNRVKRRDFIKSLKGKSYRDAFELGSDVDGVSGATYTCRALAEAARGGSRLAAQKGLNLPVPPELTPAARFGFPEIILIALFLLAYIGTKKWLKFKKTIRWVTLLAALIFIGFLYNNPLNIVLINKMLLGYWPRWQLDLYWYILLAVILFTLLTSKRNLYCERVCPFGAAQEGLALIGGGKLKFSARVHRGLRWFQRLAAFVAIGVALYLKNPGISSYEVFGAFFRLVGTNFLFILLAVVLIFSLFVKRSWCFYLCPNRAVTDYVLLMSNWVREKAAERKAKRREGGLKSK
ncbi:MAG: 4Fe-4S binding protein [Candidatus Aminicenantes bacterium]|nr:4Fe-4S binding protein [Candidatus Aminicenantes bacterium]